MRIKFNPGSPELEALAPVLAKAGDPQLAVAQAAMADIAQGLTLPLQQGVMDGDNLGGLFEQIYFAPGTAVEFPLDLLAPGSEGDFVAHVVPRFGEIPQRSVDSDYCMVPLYEVGASIDCSYKYLRDARWDVLGRMLEIIEGMFTVKFNGDGWRLILRTGVSRNLLVRDDAATAGLFTKRLVANMELYMRRNGGGNTGSKIRGRLTDLFVSPEASADTLSWQITEVSDQVRTTIFNNGPLTKIGKVLLRELDELGVGQEYEQFWDNDLAQNHTNSKEELVVGLDLQPGRQALVMPWREKPSLVEDMLLHNQRRVGVKGYAEIGFSCLDNRVVLLGQF